MTVPYVALVSAEETWNPAVHQRRDLLPLTFEIAAFDSRTPTATMTVQNPKMRPSELDGARVLVSDRSRLIFDGILETVPLGLVDDTLTLQATARPPVEEELFAAMNVLATSLKVMPFYDALFVPQGRENEWSEILAARTATVAHSRIQGTPSICDATGGSTLLTIKPRKGSVRYDPSEKIPSKYGVKLEAAWKQLVSQTFELNIESAESESLFPRLETYTPDGLIEGFPKVGATIGDGFTVSSSQCEYVLSRGVPVSPESFVAQHVAGDEELDPFIKKLGARRWSFVCSALTARLGLDYRWEAERKETAEFIFPVVAQTGSTSDDESIESLTLRGLTESEARRAWQPNTDYVVGDERVDGRFAIRCRVDHTSASTRTGAEWILLGETSYLASRRQSSFFRSARGQAALAHAMERAKTRARFAARKVRVSFEAAMPKPWLITEDMLLTLNAGSFPNQLPGGYATGRLVEYRLTWDRGERIFSGVIACCVGTGLLDEPVMGVPTGSSPSASGRVDFSVENDRVAQRAALEAAQGEVGGVPTFGLSELPATVIRITTTPAAATSFEQTVSVPISGSLGFPLQAPIEV